jgi:uncharacterized protein GlcG (DUF336 family)
MLTVGQAERMIAAAKTSATDLGIGVNIAVLDAGANLKAFIRMGGDAQGASRGDVRMQQ